MELIALVVIGTDCTYSCKSNYRTIMTTTVLPAIRYTSLCNGVEMVTDLYIYMKGFYIIYSLDNGVEIVTHLNIKGFLHNLSFRQCVEMVTDLYIKGFYIIYSLYNGIEIVSHLNIKDFLHNLSFIHWR